MFADLQLRSAPAKDPRYNHLVDRVTLCEYTQLPGLMSDRFNALCGSNTKYQEGRVGQEKFLDVLTKIYASTLDQKIKLSFDIYDFDQDGKISDEDVRIVLSHIPIKSNHSLDGKKEGLMSKGDSVSVKERNQNNQQVQQFAQLVFQ